MPSLGTPAAVVLVTHDRTLRRMVHDWPTMTLLPVTARGELHQTATYHGRIAKAALTP